MAKVAIFDLDGTLLDGAPGLRNAANAMLHTFGKPPLDLGTLIGFIGDGVAKLVERCLLHSGLPLSNCDAALAIFVRVYKDAPLVGSALYPGVMETLTSLSAQGWILGMCTNKPEEMTLTILEIFGMKSLFGSVVGGDRLSVRKPDPAPLLLVIEELGALPEEVIFVGDSRIDAATADGAGVRFLFHAVGYETKPPNPDQIWRRFDRYSVEIFEKNASTST